VAPLLGLLAALAYGVSDFCAGVASRRIPSGVVTVTGQSLGLLTAAIAVLAFPGRGPVPAVVAWGAAAGVGSGIGTFCLYQGLSMGGMGPVATLSAVLTAVIPAGVGLGVGDRPSTATLVGIGVAIPSIALVAWVPSAGGGERKPARAVPPGLGYGALAGVGFAVLFIGLDQAGTRSGAWPLLPAQLVSMVTAAPFAVRHRGRLPGRTGVPRALGLGAVAGALGGGANLVFLAATGRGSLAVVSVLTALYPAATVILARVFLSERWTRLQATGMILAAAAIALVSAG
jgi:drug/metabolite transporter (DMT)-like permease